MRWIKRLFCAHLYDPDPPVHILADLRVWIPPSVTERNWYCIKCGKVILRERTNPPINFIS